MVMWNLSMIHYFLRSMSFPGYGEWRHFYGLRRSTMSLGQSKSPSCPFSSSGLTVIWKYSELLPDDLDGGWELSSMNGSSLTVYGLWRVFEVTGNKSRQWGKTNNTKQSNTRHLGGEPTSSLEQRQNWEGSFLRPTFGYVPHRLRNIVSYPLRIYFAYHI